MNVGIILKAIRNHFKVTQTKFANSLGLEQSNLGQMETGNNKPNIYLLSKIMKIYHIDINEFLSMLDEPEELLPKLLPKLFTNQKDDKQNQHSYTPTVITVDTQGNENIIFVPIKASAGYLNGYADPEYMHQLPAYRMPGINNGVFRMFEISGQSMQPTLENGDKIVGEWLPPTDIKDGQVYIIVSKNDGICVKRCKNRLKNDNQLILQSDNKEFADIIIKADDILEVWKVKLRVTSKINNPSINRTTENAENWNAILKLAQKINDPLEMNKRIDDLEARFTSLLSFIEKKF